MNSLQDLIIKLDNLRKELGENDVLNDTIAFLIKERDSCFKAEAENQMEFRFMRGDRNK